MCPLTVTTKVKPVDNSAATERPCQRLMAVMDNHQQLKRPQQPTTGPQFCGGPTTVTPVSWWRAQCKGLVAQPRCCYGCRCMAAAFSEAPDPRQAPLLVETAYVQWAAGQQAQVRHVHASLDATAASLKALQWY